MNHLFSKVRYRAKLIINQLNESYDEHVSLKGSRDKAKKFWQQLAASKKQTVVDRKLRNKIKAYCRDAFGSSSYWPWLAVYSELRGEFKPGWIPDDYYRFKFLSDMNPETFTNLSEAKSIDCRLFGDAIVEPMFFRTNGQYCQNGGKIMTEADVYEILRAYNNEIIIKPDHSHGGEGIMFRQAHELQLEELPADSDLIFQRVLKQHPVLDRIYPHSINTFRVLTHINDDGKIIVKFIFLRFGRGGTRVDNTGSGGGWVFIRRDGQPESTAYDNWSLPIGTHHPDTHVEFAKLVFPWMSKVRALCKQAHSSFPYCRIIGWDVCINDQGEPQLIEWNAQYPGFWTIEALFGPFFDDVSMEGISETQKITNSNLGLRSYKGQGIQLNPR